MSSPTPPKQSRLRRPGLTVLVNRVGYDTAGPKRFVCRSTENLGPSGHFELVDGTGRTLLEGTASRVRPPGPDGPFHYAGDFTPFRTPGGDFQLRFEAGNRLATSSRFGVGSDILWRLTKPLAVDFLRRSRATRSCYRGEGVWNPPGVLEEDDRFHDVGGGWFDRGCEGGTSLELGARAITALAFCLERDERDPQVRAELRWGAEWLRRLMIGYPESGRLIARAEDDGALTPLPPRRHGGTENGGASGRPSSVTGPRWALAAGFLYARLSELLGDLDLLRRGERFWEEYSPGLAGLAGLADLDPGAAPSRRRSRFGGAGATGAMLLSDVALHVALLEPRCLASAERRAEALLEGISPGADRDPGEAGTAEPRPGRFAVWETPGASLPAAALTYFADSLPDHPLTPRAKEAVGAFLDERVARAAGTPLGLVPHDRGAPASRAAGAGHSDVPAAELPAIRAEEAWQALFAHRVTGRAEYVELAMNALNWVMGLNDRGACLLCGAGAFGQGLAPPSSSPGRSVEEGAEGGDGGREVAIAALDSAGIGGVAAYLTALAFLRV